MNPFFRRFYMFRHFLFTDILNNITKTIWKSCRHPFIDFPLTNSKKIISEAWKFLKFSICISTEILVDGWWKKFNVFSNALQICCRLDDGVILRYSSILCEQEWSIKWIVSNIDENLRSRADILCYYLKDF